MYVCMLKVLRKQPLVIKEQQTATFTQPQFQLSQHSLGHLPLDIGPRSCSLSVTGDLCKIKAIGKFYQIFKMLQLHPWCYSTYRMLRD